MCGHNESDVELNLRTLREKTNIIRTVIYNKYNLLYERFFIINIIYYMNSYSLIKWVFKVFSLRFFNIHIFENTEQEKRKNFSILWFFSKCSKIQFYV